ncbi:MAG: hypothetical protein QOH22_2095 [Gemmatimonadaceae bacterium]|jgi:hypothetical protein|nr:hypothetical protein [Gemmatimonadaceae bacterium]
MPNRSNRLITVAVVVMLASGCSADSPIAPSSAASAPLNTAIKSDIAATAGNAIAGDLESMIANEASAVGSFAAFASSARLSSSTDGTSAPAEQPNCTVGSQPGVVVCVKEPGPGDRLQCTYSEEKKLYLCVKLPDPTPVNPPAPESGDRKTVVKSYQFLDASGNVMETFVKGTTDAIHFLTKTDGAESRDNNRSVIHSLRDATLSGFLGPNRIWNGFGSSADTTVHTEGLSTRTYTGLSVDTVKAVTFLDDRKAHPYPLSGVFVRVVDYQMVSTGTQLETTTVHKRAVVTFNGTANVPITLGDYSCLLHLDTHKVDACK